MSIEFSGMLLFWGSGGDTWIGIPIVTLQQCFLKYGSRPKHGHEHVHKEKTIIGNEAMTFLLSFSTTYLCEQGFSALTVVKTKARYRLIPGNDLRVALSKIEPCIGEIVKGKYQFHQSHWTNDLFLINCCVKIQGTLTGCLSLIWVNSRVLTCKDVQNEWQNKKKSDQAILTEKKNWFAKPNAKMRIYIFNCSLSSLWQSPNHILTPFCLYCVWIHIFQAEEERHELNTQDIKSKFHTITWSQIE